MLKSVDEQALSSPRATAALYERVLGGEAALVHPQVAALHCGRGRVQAQGWMRVDHGQEWPCRLVASLARLPRAGARVRTRLTIRPGQDEERWIRRFGHGPAICSRQTTGRPGELLERFGILSFVFTLETDGDVLRFRQRACRIQLGPVAVPVPEAWAPRVTAAVHPATSGGVAVDVRVESPLGLLLAYTGVVAVEDARGDPYGR